MHHYRAFGLAIHSEFAIDPLPAGDAEAAQPVVVRLGRVPASLPAGTFFDAWAEIAPEELLLRVPEVGRFHVERGARITVEREAGAAWPRVLVYVLGSCMGAVLHQRGILPLHGSCVCQDGRAILIMGESGAGKSTLAAEFLARGWRLMTDDVAPVIPCAGRMLAYSGYPMQKLWPDSLARYARPEQMAQVLYRDGGREKYGLHAHTAYHEGTAALALVVLLAAGGTQVLVEPVQGFAKVDQLVQNTYRSWMLVSQAQKQAHFQRCVDIAARIPMALALRTDDGGDAARLYERLAAMLEGEEQWN